MVSSVYFNANYHTMLRYTFFFLFLFNLGKRQSAQLSRHVFENYNCRTSQLLQLSYVEKIISVTCCSRKRN